MNPTMPELEATVARVAGIVAASGASYHATGGLVASLYGEPRFTQDIDLVIRFAEGGAQVERLIGLLATDFLVDADLIRRAAAQSKMFQALDRQTGIKVDFHVGEDVPGELGRSVVLELFPGTAVPVVSREDALLSKLLWIRKGSHKSRRDAMMMVRRGHWADWSLVAQRAAALGVGDLLEEIRAEALPPET